MENAFFTDGDGGGVTARFDAVATGFSANELDAFVVNEAVECANGVGAATDTGEDCIGQASFGSEDLLASFVADDALEIADHLWEGMGSGSGAEAVVGVVGM